MYNSRRDVFDGLVSLEDYAKSSRTYAKVRGWETKSRINS